MSYTITPISSLADKQEETNRAALERVNQKKEQINNPSSFITPPQTGGGSSTEAEVLTSLRDGLTIQPLSTRTQRPQIQDVSTKDINVPQLDFEIQSKSDNFVSRSDLNYFPDRNKINSNNGNDIGIVRIDFSSGVDSSVVSEKSLNILRQASIASDNNYIKITSTLRSPAKQADIMYDYNLTKGFVKQYGLYGSSGDQVIQVHEENVGKSKEDILDLMVSKINQLEPSKVSKHCGNHNDINVFDIYVGNLKNPDLLYNELLKLEGSLINKVIDERDRGCIHVEIKQ